MLLKKSGQGKIARQAYKFSSMIPLTSATNSFVCHKAVSSSFRIARNVCGNHSLIEVRGFNVCGLPILCMLSKIKMFVEFQKNSKPHSQQTLATKL